MPIVEVDAVVNLLFVHHPLHQLMPIFERCFAEGKTARDELVDTCEFIAQESHLVLLGQVLPQNGLGKYLFSLLAEGTLLVYQLVEDRSQRPNIIARISCVKLGRAVANR